MNTIRTIAAWSLVAGCGPAVAQHVDVMPVSVDGQPGVIETGAFDFDGFQVAAMPPTRVYENDLDEPVPDADLLVGEAGVTALSATTATALLSGTGYGQLPGGVDLRFDFRAFSLPGKAGAANLWYWDSVDDDTDGDYADDIDFNPAAGTTLTFEKLGGLFSASVNGGAADVPGFVIDTTLQDNPGTDDDETGFLHVDLDAILDDGDADPLTALPLGVYVISLTIAHESAVGAEPLYWVFNGGLGEEGEPAVEAAVAYVPEPASALMLLAGGALLARASQHRKGKAIR